MISHKHKCIFIHIPKCAGSSIRDHFFQGMSFDWRGPNYDVLYGWCPKRKIHLQHATAKQLLETELIKEEVWDEYFKFTFVRNPWDRAYSDYLWIKKDRKINGSFKQYINATGSFKEVFTNRDSKNYRGDHKLLQTDFFDLEGEFKLDFVGRFESLNQDMEYINNLLHMPYSFEQHSKRNKNRKSHYSLFYTRRKKSLFEKVYAKDIKLLNYTFEDKRTGLVALKKYI